MKSRIDAIAATLRPESGGHASNREILTPMDARKRS
jgi:hypothetical protein